MMIPFKNNEIKHVTIDLLRRLAFHRDRQLSKRNSNSSCPAKAGHPDRLAAWKDLARENKVGSLLFASATKESARVVAEAVL